jgi:hypothetical protein
MTVGLRMEIAVGPICRLAVGLAAARTTGILHPPAALEMVRKVRFEVAYSWALRGAGGMMKGLPGAWI